MHKSNTFAFGPEFAHHKLLRQALNMRFCDACASWQKGGVENANGRLLWVVAPPARYRQPR